MQSPTTEKVVLEKLPRFSRTLHIILVPWTHVRWKYRLFHRE